MCSVLYLTRNGLLEPLGQSQVFAYLRGLSRNYTITLVTHEKPKDWADSARVARTRVACEAYGIRWLPQRFRQRPRILAPAFSMLRMTWLVWREVRGGRVELIHARSYIPAAVALVVYRLTRTPFIFDMRALWPEELIIAGGLRRGSLLHKAIAWIERTCLAQSAAVVSLTHAALEHLHRVYPKELNGQRIVVIPTCADLVRFTPAAKRPEGPRIHGCIGTVLSGWFRIDWLASWMSVVVSRDPEARLEVITCDDAEQVRLVLDPERQLGERLTIGSRAPEDMPEAVREHDLSIMFFTEGLSKLGSSPTRMAEVLGCGLPVVANAGVGDVTAIICDWRVGVLVEGPEPAQINAALDALCMLNQDPELPSRCRRAAEAIFSLDAGTEAYRTLYTDVLAESRTDFGSVP